MSDRIEPQFNSRRLWTVGELVDVLHRQMPDSTIEFTDTEILVHPADIPIPDGNFEWGAIERAIADAWRRR